MTNWLITVSGCAAQILQVLQNATELYSALLSPADGKNSLHQPYVPGMSVSSANSPQILFLSHTNIVSISLSGGKNPTVFPISQSSWDSAEYNIPPLVFCIVTFVLTFWEEMGVWAACRNSARAVVPAEFLRAVWKQQAPEPLPVSLPEAGSSPAAPAVHGCTPAPPDFEHSGCQRKVDSEVLLSGLLLFLFPPPFLTLSAETGADRCELTLPLLGAKRPRASP